MPVSSFLVFGHKSHDTDATASAIIWAWYLNEIIGVPAEAVLLGLPNTETIFVLDRWMLLWKWLGLKIFGRRSTGYFVRSSFSVATLFSVRVA
jgi:inorganic pyrophosphatase/exopolyphosphatase